jgi:hypothetical protein
MAYTARCRIAVRHGRSALAQLGVALRAGGAEPVSIDYHRIDQAHDAVDLVIELPDVIDRAGLARLLIEAGAGRLVSYVPPPVEVDRILGLLLQCRDLLAAGDAVELDRRVGAAIAGFCGTATAIVSSMPAAMAYEAARFAVARHRSIVQRTGHLPPALGGHRLTEAWLLAAPDGGLHPTRVALVARAVAEPFSATEIARVEAILAIRRRLAGPDGSPLLTEPGATAPAPATASAPARAPAALTDGTSSEPAGTDEMAR